MDQDNLIYSDFDWTMSDNQQQDMSYWSHTAYTQTDFTGKPHHTTPSPPPCSYDTRVHPRFKSANARLSSDLPLVGPPTLLDNTFTNFSNGTSSFQFDIVLDAPTAVTKKHDEEQVTYLNRGQSYLIDFNPTFSNQGTLTSTIYLDFHEPSHRVIGEDYWKYWISQQDIPLEARAIDLDLHQTTGIYNISLTSFDRVTFDWHSRFGAKVYIRFNCLSTDFSKIKGVKGIPMRIVVETTQHLLTIPHDITPYKGTFQKVSDIFEYKESCYCKIKLFRDKGAERKNKDDRKQKDKQIDKVIASTNGNPEQHPLWLILSQKHKSVSRFIEIPPDVTPPSPEPFTKRKRPISEIKNTLQKQKKSTVLTIYVWTHNFSSNPHEILLETFTTQNLKEKLAIILDVHPSRIAEILWHRKKQDILVLVEDTFISEHISDGEMMTVNWELKTDGNLRLILEF